MRTLFATLEAYGPWWHAITKIAEGSFDFYYILQCGAYYLQSFDLCGIWYFFVDNFGLSVWYFCWLHWIDLVLYSLRISLSIPLLQQPKAILYLATDFELGHLSPVKLVWMSPWWRVIVSKYGDHVFYQFLCSRYLPWRHVSGRWTESLMKLPVLPLHLVKMLLVKLLGPPWYQSPRWSPRERAAHAPVRRDSYWNLVESDGFDAKYWGYKRKQTR